MALTISSLSDYITVGTAAIPTTNGCIAIWFKPTWAYNSGVDHEIFRVRDDVGGIHIFDGFGVGTDSNFYCGFYNAPTDYRASGSASALIQNAWNHCLVNWATGLTTSVYINGVVQTNNNLNVSLTSPWNSAGKTKYIGKDGYGNSGTSSADVSDYALWSDTRSQAEITSLSKGWAPNKISPSTLVDYLTLQTTTIGGTNWAGGTAGTVNGCANASGPPCNLGLPEPPIIIPPQKSIIRASRY